MDFDTFIGKAWEDHAAQPQAVAERLGEGRLLATRPAQIAQLANLAHHVYGEHLGEWRGGTAFIERLSTLPLLVADDASTQALRRCLASLALSERSDAGTDGLAPSDRIRVMAMAASNLSSHDTARARRLLESALDEARRSGLDANDPMNRALAVAGNGLACTLEQKASRSADERELMILAAQTARHHWERAGTWLEVERAEYRLAQTWLRAGDFALARTHAQLCIEIVAAHDGAALERFFAWEALGSVERAAGNPTGRAQALARAREAFVELEAADKGWCAVELDKLAAD